MTDATTRPTVRLEDVLQELADPRRLRSMNAMKRVADVVTVVAAAPVALPISAAIAAAIRFIDGSPVLFRQQRLGFRERPFDILKFRSMRTDGDSDDDRNRITRLGRFLRSTSLDELPQLLNVLRGDMSLVGPRPLYLQYLPHYTNRERLRHAVRPGVTGYAQVSGRNSARWNERLRFDIDYVCRLSPWTDIQVILGTVRHVLSRSDVAFVPRDTGEPLDVERSYPNEGTKWLRRFNLLDVETRVWWMRDERIRRYMQLPVEFTVDSTREWYHDICRDPWRDDFVVFDSETGQLLSMLGLKSRPGEDQGTLYIFVNPEAHGQGIGRASVRLLAEWARSSRYGSLDLTVNERNQGAVRLYETQGFQLAKDDGGRRQYFLEV